MALLSPVHKRSICGVLAVSGTAVLLILFQNASPAPKVKKCSAEKIAEVLTPPTATSWSSTVDCHLKLKPDDVVRKTLVVTGNIQGLRIKCEKDDSGKSSTFTSGDNVTASIFAHLAPKMPQDEIEKLHKKENIKKGKYLYSAVSEINHLVDIESENLNLIDKAIVQGKTDYQSLKHHRDLLNLVAKIELKLVLLKLYKAAIKVNDYSLYPKVLAAMTFDTKPKKQKQSHEDYLLEGSSKNKYLTDKLATITKKYQGMSGQRILIISKLNSDTQKWERPSNIKIENCQVNGGIRVMGMAPTGEDRWSLEKHFLNSSKTEDHIKNSQEAAPTGIKLVGLNIRGKVYFSPGVTKSIIKHSNIEGSIYLDAESSGNYIWANNFFNTAKSDDKTREFIAIDGSANNIVAWNKFGNDKYPLDRGGIYLYRNCGENGASRHQISNNNTIRDNEFTYSKSNKNEDPAIFINSRYGLDQYYCSYDNGNKYGSGQVNNKETIEGTAVYRNKTLNWNSNAEPLQFSHLKNSKKIEQIKEY